MAVIKKVIRRTLKFAERYPWIIPLFGFVSGVASFFLVERKQEQFAQIVSILMLVSWLWLALENTLQRGISHWFHIKIPPVVLRYVNQLVHQESLFFVIPFFFITTAWNSGQMVFTSLLIIAAFVSLIDPIYYRWLAPRPWLYFSFHGITLFAALLTTLPLLFHLPTAQSYIWALGIAVVLSSPGIIRSISLPWWKRFPIVALIILITVGAGLLVRPWIPPASIWLTQVAITDHIDDETRSPNKRLKTITPEQLHQGIYAYTAIHAPRGLHERIYHVWYHNGKQLDKIALDIKGGNENGYRSWSHKVNFPEQAIGSWQIRVETEVKQVLGILRFQVATLDNKTETKKAASSPGPTQSIQPTQSIKPEKPETRRSAIQPGIDKLNTDNQTAQAQNVEAKNIEEKSAEEKSSEKQNAEEQKTESGGAEEQRSEIDETSPSEVNTEAQVAPSEN